MLVLVVVMVMAVGMCGSSTPPGWPAGWLAGWLAWRATADLHYCQSEACCSPGNTSRMQLLVCPRMYLAVLLPREAVHAGRQRCTGCLCRLASNLLLLLRCGQTWAEATAVVMGRVCEYVL